MPNGWGAVVVRFRLGFRMLVAWSEDVLPRSQLRPDLLEYGDAGCLKSPTCQIWFVSHSISPIYNIRRLEMSQRADLLRIRPALSML